MSRLYSEWKQIIETCSVPIDLNFVSKLRDKLKRLVAPDHRHQLQEGGSLLILYQNFPDGFMDDPLMDDFGCLHKIFLVYDQLQSRDFSASGTLLHLLAQPTIILSFALEILVDQSVKDDKYFQKKKVDACNFWQMIDALTEMNDIRKSVDTIYTQFSTDCADVFKKYISNQTGVTAFFRRNRKIPFHNLLYFFVANFLKNTRMPNDCWTKEAIIPHIRIHLSGLGLVRPYSSKEALADYEQLVLSFQEIVMKHYGLLAVISDPNYSRRIEEGAELLKASMRKVRRVLTTADITNNQLEKQIDSWLEPSVRSRSVNRLSSISRRSRSRAQTVYENEVQTQRQLFRTGSLS